MQVIVTTNRRLESPAHHQRVDQELQSRLLTQQASGRLITSDAVERRKTDGIHREDGIRSRLVMLSRDARGREGKRGGDSSSRHQPPSQKAGWLTRVPKSLCGSRKQIQLLSRVARRTHARQQSANRQTDTGSRDDSHRLERTSFP